MYRLDRFGFSGSELWRWSELEGRKGGREEERVSWKRRAQRGGRKRC